MSRSDPGIYRSAVILILGLVTLLVAEEFLVLPQQRRLRELRGQVAGSQQHLAFLERLSTSSGRGPMQGKIKHLHQQIDDLRFLPEEADHLPFRFQERAQQIGLQGFSCRHIAGKVDRYIRELKAISQRHYQIRFRCDFPELMAFVNDFERHQPLVFVQDMQIMAHTGEHEVQLHIVALCRR